MNAGTGSILGAPGCAFLAAAVVWAGVSPATAQQAASTKGRLNPIIEQFEQGEQQVGIQVLAKVRREDAYADATARRERQGLQRGDAVLDTRGHALRDRVPFTA